MLLEAVCGLPAAAGSKLSPLGSCVSPPRRRRRVARRTRALQRPWRPRPARGPTRHPGRTRGRLSLAVSSQSAGGHPPRLAPVAVGRWLRPLATQRSISGRTSARTRSRLGLPWTTRYSSSAVVPGPGPRRRRRESCRLNMSLGGPAAYPAAYSGDMNRASRSPTPALVSCVDSAARAMPKSMTRGPRSSAVSSLRLARSPTRIAVGLGLCPDQARGDGREDQDEDADCAAARSGGAGHFRICLMLTEMVTMTAAGHRRCACRGCPGMRLTTTAPRLGILVGRSQQ